MSTLLSTPTPDIVKAHKLVNRIEAQGGQKNLSKLKDLFQKIIDDIPEEFYFQLSKKIDQPLDEKDKNQQENLKKTVKIILSEPKIDLHAYGTCPCCGRVDHFSEGREDHFSIKISTPLRCLVLDYYHHSSDGPNSYQTLLEEGASETEENVELDFLTQVKNMLNGSITSRDRE